MGSGTVFSIEDIRYTVALIIEEYWYMIFEVLRDYLRGRG
jgi:hypothetical protein